MANTICFSLQDATDESLEKIKKDIEKEINRRHERVRIKLIENFKVAFSALLSAGIEVRCVDCDGEIDFRVYNWDDFHFN